MKLAIVPWSTFLLFHNDDANQTNPSANAPAATHRHVCRKGRATMSSSDSPSTAGSGLRSVGGRPPGAPRSVRSLRGTVDPGLVDRKVRQLVLVQELGVRAIVHHRLQSHVEGVGQVVVA